MRKTLMASAAALLLGTVSAEAGTKGGLYDLGVLMNESHPFASAPATPYAAPAPTRVAPPAPTDRYVPTDRYGQPQQRFGQAAASGAAPARPMAEHEMSSGGGGWFDGLYLSLGGGLDFPDDISGRTRTGAATQTGMDSGFFLSMALGKTFGTSWRAEGELSYRQADFDNVRTGATTVSGRGDQSVTAMMLNGYYDFRFRLPVVPYIGVGAGAAFISGSDVAIAGTVAEGRDATEFAYQGIIGLSYDIGARWHLGLEGRYFGTTDDDVASASGGLNLRVDL